MKKHPQDYAWSSIEKLLLARNKTESIKQLQQFIEARWNPFKPQKGKYQSTILKCFLSDIYGWDDFWVKNAEYLTVHIKEMLKDPVDSKELYSILGHAIVKSRVNMVKLLVDSGVNVHGLTEPAVGDSEPPSSKSVIYLSRSLEMIKYLKSIGAAVDVQNENSYLWLRCARDVVCNNKSLQELDKLEEYIPAYIPKEVGAEFGVLGFSALNSGLQSISARLVKLDGAERLFSVKKGPIDGYLFVYIKKKYYPNSAASFGALDLPKANEIEKREIETRMLESKYDDIRLLDWCRSILKVDRPYAIDILVDVLGKEYLETVFFSESVRRINNDILSLSSRGYSWVPNNSDKTMVGYILENGSLKSLNRLFDRFGFDRKKIVEILNESKCLDERFFNERTFWGVLKNINKTGGNKDEEYKAFALKLLYLTQVRECAEPIFARDTLYTNSSYKWLIDSGLSVADSVKIEISTDDYLYYLKNSIYPNYKKGLDVCWGEVVDKDGGKDFCVWQECLINKLKGVKNKENVPFGEFNIGFAGGRNKISIEVSIKSIFQMYEHSDGFKEDDNFNSLDKLKSLVEGAELKSETAKVLKQLKAIDGRRTKVVKRSRPGL